jgi:serine phosphatase RsbU (regulator of sigma subunit)
MTLFRSLIRAAATSESFTSSETPQPLDHAARLGQVISFTNNYIADIHGEANMFATVFIAVFEASEGRLSYINCGNEPPLLFGPHGEITPLPPTGPVVGILPEAQFNVKTTTLQENDLLVAFTDGIPDAIDADDNSFGAPRLQECLSRRTRDPQALLDGVIQALEQFTGDVQQFDDITLLAVKRLNPRSETP